MAQQQPRNFVDVVIGHTAPFRLVLRKEDSWEPTLEEINGRCYDYVKLNRLSAWLDVGIRPFSMGIGFDGSLVLPLIENFATREGAVNKFNETLGTLLLGGVYFEAIEATDTSRGRLYFNGYVKILAGGEGAVSRTVRGYRSTHTSAIDSINLLNPRTIQASELEQAFSKGVNLFAKLEGLDAAILLRGTTYYVKHEWSESLIFLWTTIEQAINIIWKQIVLKRKPTTSIKGRSDFLKDFRTWTTSTKIEVAYQLDLIPEDVYMLLNIARKARNEFVHNGQKLTEEPVRAALTGLMSVLSLIITDFTDNMVLKATLDDVDKFKRDDLVQRKKDQKKIEVTHWLSIPPIPGDSDWGDKEFEVIQDIQLVPLSE